MSRALVFDFDQTLSPHTMADPILRHWGLDPAEFWVSCSRLVSDQGFDLEHSYLYRLVEEGRKDPARRLNEASMQKWGREIALYPGLEAIGEDAGLFGEIEARLGVGGFEAFIVSGGLTPLVEGCLEARGMKRYFNAVFACRMAEEDPGDGLGPRLSFPKETVGFTIKTQKLFSISKGSHRPGGPHVNDKIRDKAFTIPFKDMLYLGDGHSDIAAFATLKKFGGTCFAVHQPGDKASESRAKAITEDGRANAFYEADYRHGSALRIAILNWAR